MAGQAQDLSWSDVEHDHARSRQVVDRVDATARLDLSTERAEIGGERVRDPLGAAAGQRPAVQVSEETKRQAERGGRRAIQVLDRVCSHTGEQCPRALTAEALREPDCGTQGEQAETGGYERVARDR